jgi:hypothetical protein
MVSLDEEKLQNILLTLKKEADGEYIIKEVKLYILSKIYNKFLITRATSFTEEFIGKKVYAMNKTDNQVLIKVFVLHDSDENSEEYKTFIEDIRNDKLFEENNLSLNTIKFDTYYEDGMLNA